MKKVTNTIFLTSPRKMPNNNKSACCKLVASMCLLKTEVNAVKIKIRRDRLDYEGFTSTVPDTQSTFKIHLNSVVSAPKEKRMNLDTKDFYYGTPMKDFGYGHILLELILDEFIK